MASSSGTELDSVAAAACQNLAPQAAALVHFQQVDGHVLGPKPQQLVQRLLPARRRLVRQPGDQIQADV